MIFVSSALTIRVVNRLGLLSIFRIGYKRKIKNAVFNIPVIENKEGLIYHQKIGEPYLVEVFQKIIENGNFVFLDAGVNFGQTLLKVKAIKSSIEYIGFEPSGLCSYYVTQLIKINKLKDAKLIRCALSDTTGVLTLHSQSDGDTRATILDNEISNEEDKFQELVPVVTLDSLTSIITARGKNFFLKVDVEGAELMVFKGAENFINQFRPVVVFENLPYNEHTERGEAQQQLGAFFISKKYKLFLLDETNWKVENISLINNKQDLSKTNYLAVPEELTSILTAISGK